jgi:pyruvate dehydrogenase E2 component (dihydrolipoamide acetyltransferase)
MATQVIMPKQGLQMTEGTIIDWKVSVGDMVSSGQAILEIETDKLTIDVDAPEDGVVLKLLYQEGDTVPVAETIAVIGKPGEDITDMLGDIPGTVGEESSGNAEKPASATDIPSMPATSGVTVSDSAGEGAAERVYASPRARWRAKEKGIPLNSIDPSGPEGLIIERDVFRVAEKKYIEPAATPLAKKVASVKEVDLKAVKSSKMGGKITKADVLRAMEHGAFPEAKIVEREVQEGGGYLLPHDGMRRTIAKRMNESLSIAAQANHRMDVDFSELVRLRGKLKSSGLSVSYTDILVKIAAGALKLMPLMNSSWTDEGIMIKEEINVGLAVAVPDGLVVPVLRNADILSLPEMYERSRELIKKAQNGRLGAADMSGGTFTITNLGMYDVDSFTAIINQPESGILAVGRIVEKPVVLNGEIVVRPMVTLSLTYDHRVIDGAPAAEFLRTVKNFIENPYLLL